MTERPLSVVAGSDRQGRLFGRKVLSERLWARPTPVFSASAVTLYWDEQRALHPADQAALECGPDLLLVPDLEAVWPYPTRPQTNLCLADLTDLDGRPLDISPRQMLRRQVARAEARSLQFRTATELEFYLSPVPQLPGGYMSVQPGRDLEHFLDTLYLEMEEAGIPLHALQAELGTGQWEVSFEPAGPLLTADRHVIFKHVAAQLAHDCGFDLSFAACPDETQPGSSCHVHCSVYGPAGNVLGPEAATGADVT